MLQKVQANRKLTLLSSAVVRVEGEMILLSWVSCLPNLNIDKSDNTTKYIQADTDIYSHLSHKNPPQVVEAGISGAGLY